MRSFGSHQTHRHSAVKVRRRSRTRFAGPHGRQARFERLEDRRLLSMDSWAFGFEDWSYTYFGAVDSAGDLCVTGRFERTIDFDPGPGVVALSTSDDSAGYVAKYSASGSLVWVRQFGRTAHGVAVDSTGAIYVTGNLHGTVTFGGDKAGDQAAVLTSSGGADIWIAKLSPEGTLLWVSKLGGADDDYARGLAVNEQGVWVTGDWNSAFVAHFSAEGQTRWIKQFGAQGQASGWSIAADRLGNAYAVGRFSGSVEFASGASLTSAGGWDVYIMQLTPQGSPVWARRAGSSTGDDLVRSIAVCDTGSDPANWPVYISGDVTGTADFGDLRTTDFGSTASYVWRITAGGSESADDWVRQFGSNSGANGWGLALDPEGGVYATGHFAGTADFDPAPHSERLLSCDIPGGFVVRLDSQGEYRSAWQMAPQGRFVVVDSEGDLRVGGGSSYGGPVPPSQSIVPQYAAYFRFNPNLSLVTGKSYVDLDGDGVREREPGIPEPGLSGQAIDVHDLNGQLIVTTTSNMHGDFGFAVAPGTYVVSQRPAAGWSQTGNISHTIVVPGPEIAGYDPSLAIHGGEFGNYAPTVRKTYASTDTPKAGKGFQSAIDVPESFLISDINVTVDMADPHLHEMRLYLQRPDRTEFYLANVYDLNGENLTATVFDQEAGLCILDAVAPYTGRFRPPYVNLASLYGTNAFGRWTLRVTSQWTTPQTLNSWQIEFVTVVEGVPTVSIDHVQVDEGDSGTTQTEFTIALSSSSSLPISVAYATRDGTALAGRDYEATSGLVTFAPGETRQTVRIPVYGDAWGEQDETFYVVLSDATGATISAGEGTCTITDDDNTGWVFRIGGEGTDTATKVAVAGDGTVYVAGAFQGCVDFDPGPLVHELTAAGIYDGFLAKYNPDRSLAWMEQVAMGRGTVCQRDGWGGVEDIALDDDGNVYVAGWFSGKAMFGGTVLETTGQFDELDAFVARYTPGGELGWVKHIAVGAGGDARAYGLAVGRHGEVYVTGEFYDTAAFGATVLTSAGTSESFVACLSAADGQVAWAGSLGGPGRDLGYAVAVTSGGDPVVAGHFSDTAIIGGQAVTSRGESDSYVARLDRLTGQAVWVRQLGGEGIDESWALTADEQGNIYTTGTFTSTAQFGSQSLTSAGRQDVYLSKLDASGAVLWTRQLGGAGDDTSVALTLDALGRPYVRGHFQGSVDFDPGPGVAMRSTRGTSDGFVWELDAQGAFRRAWQMGGAGCSSGGGGIALDDEGSVYVAGGFSGHGTIATPVGDLAAISDDADVFLLKMTVGVPVPDPPLATGDSYVANVNRQLAVASPGLLANDTIASGAALEAVLVAGPAHGTLTLGADGSFVYQPAPGYTGNDSFSYRASDGQTSSGPATVTITITPNRAPVAGNNYYTARMNAAFMVAAPGPLAEDWDANGDPLTASLVAGPAHGTLVFNADGWFTYTPNPGYQGRDQFTYRASDGQAASNTATVEINVVPNAVPVPLGDVYAVNAGRNVDIHAPGVLLNDMDVDGDRLTAILVDGPQHGTLAFNADGSFSYLPEDGYIGDDQFTYRTNDGYDQSAVATVTIQVKPPAADGSWAFAIGGPLEDQTRSMRMDSQGNVYVAGAFRGTVDFDPGPGRTELTASGEFRDFDAFLAKYSPAGELVWVQSIKNAMAVKLAIDAADDIYLIANFGGVTQVGAVELRSKAKTDSFAAKFSSDGTVLWAQDLGMGDSGAYGLDIAAGRNNDVYVAGMFTISAFGRSHALVNTTWTDAALAKLDSRDGAVQWGEQVEGIFQDFALVVAVDAAGYPYLHGMLWDVAKFDDIEIECNGEDNCDTFLAKFDVEDGHALWAEALGGTSLEFVEAIAADDEGNVYLGGMFYEQADLGGHTLDAVGGFDIYLAKVDGSGQVLWARSLGGSGEHDSLADLSVDDQGFIYLAGVFDGVADFDPGPGVALLSSPDVRTGFGLILDGEGQYQRAWKLDGPLEPANAVVSVGFGLEIDSCGNTVGMAGVQYGIGPVELAGSNWVNLPGKEYDVYVVRFAPQQQAGAAPVALPDTYQADEGMPLSVASPGVLTNDSDANNDSLTAVLVSGPAHGTLVLNADGSFVYTAETGFFGEDGFTYRAFDGQEESATATVALGVSPLLTIQSAEAIEGDSGTTELVFTVTLNRAWSTDLVLAYSTADRTAVAGADYLSAAGPLVFRAGETSSTIRVSVIGDTTCERDEELLVRVLTPAGEVVREAVGTIHDDDAPIAVIAAPALATSEAGGAARFEVALRHAPTADVTIELWTSNPAEGIVSPTTLRFTPANWNVPQAVTVTGIDDPLIDGDAGYAVILAPAVSGDSRFHGADPADVAVVNFDDDVAGVTIAPTTGLVTTEAGGTATFTVALTSRPLADMTLDLSSGNPAEGMLLTTRLVFTPANWNIPQAVAVRGVDDRIDDGDVSYKIITAALISADPNYSGLDPADVVLTNLDDDTAGVTVSPTAGLVTTEAGSTAMFTIVLDTQPRDNVSIGLASSLPGEGTVWPTAVVFTPANWNVPQTVTVTGVDDYRDDGDVAFTIVTLAAVSTDSAYNGLDPADVSVTNLDDDASGIVVLANGTLRTSEAGGTAELWVVLACQPIADVTVGVSSSNTAEGTVSPAVLVFTPANWNVPQRVTVTGIDDPVDDGDASYTIVLAPATSLDPGYDGLDPADIAATTTDDDTAGIILTAGATLATDEKGGTAAFSVRLATQPLAEVTIDLSSSNPAEGLVTPSRLVFTPANWNVPQQATITGVDDYLDDGDVAYTIRSAPAASLDPLYAGLDVADVAVTNRDNDTTGVAIHPAAVLVTTEDGGTATFSVVLICQPRAEVVINLRSGNTAEGTVSPTALEFTPANWNTPQTVVVTGVDDWLVDGESSYLVLLGAAISVDPLYQGLDPADVAVINRDNDAAAIFVTAADNLRTTESGGTATFTVVLATRPAADVEISLSTSDTTEGILAADRLLFTPANWNTPQTVVVSGVDDSLVDGDVPYRIEMARARSLDPFYDRLEVAAVSLTNVDDDTPGFRVSPTAGLETSEAGGTAAFTVVLASLPAADVTVGVSSGNLAEGVVSPALLVFTPANWNLPQTVTVTGVDDLVDDSDMAYSIRLAPTASLDPGYAGLDPADVLVTNLDDDTAGLVLSVGTNLVTSEAGGTAAFTVALATRPVADVELVLSSSNTAEGTVAPHRLVFTPANWSTAQTVTVSGVDDLVDDGDAGYTVLLAVAAAADPVYQALDAATVAVTNRDDDTAGVAVSPRSGLATTEAGGTADFTVVLTSQPVAEVLIGLSSSHSAEGTVSPAALVFTPTNWSTPQTVTVRGVDDDMDDGDVSYTILAAVVSSDPQYHGRMIPGVVVTNRDDDTAAVIVTAGSNLTTTEAGGTAAFYMVLATRPRAEVTIDLASSCPAEGTVAPSRLVFTPANWNIAQTVTISGVDDRVVDGERAYAIITAPVASSDPSYQGLNPADVTVTNLDDDAAGITVISGSPLRTSEAGGTATFSVVLTSQPRATVTVGVSSSNTAEGRVSPAVLAFTPGNWNVPQPVVVSGVDDPTEDGDVEYTIVLAPAASLDPGYLGLDPADLSATNLDNDTAAIILTAHPGLVTTEAGGTATFTIVLATRPLAEVTIDLSSSNTAEGTVAPSRLVFTPAQWNTAQTVTITGVDDYLDDGDVSYAIHSSAAASLDPRYAGLEVADVPVTNQDDDTAGVVVTPIGTLVTTEAGGTATFTVVLASQPVADVVIGVASDNISAAAVTPAAVVFTSDNWHLAQTVTVRGVDDDRDDGDTAYAIRLTAAASLDPQYRGLAIPDLPAINRDDDTAGIRITLVSPPETSEAGGTAVFSLVLQSQPSADVLVPFSSDHPGEGALSLSQVIFTPENWRTPQTVTVVGQDDCQDDGDVAYRLITGPAASLDPAYDGLDAVGVGLVNLDDDTAGILVTTNSLLVTSEEGDTAHFSVRLSAQPAADVILVLTLVPAGEALLSNESLHFTAADWDRPQVVTLSGVDDLVADGDQSYRVVIAPSATSDGSYLAVRPVEIEAVNRDNDRAAVLVNAPELWTTESGATASFSLSLNGPPTAEVTIELASTHPGEVVVSPARVVFSRSNWNTSQSVTLAGVDDTRFDGRIACAVTFAPAASADPRFHGLELPALAVGNEDNEPATDALGPIDYLSLTDLDLSSGTRGHSCQATHSGYLSALVQGQPADSLQLDLWDADGKRLATAVSSAGTARIDHPRAVAGSTYYVTLGGHAAAPCALELVNLVQELGSQVTVFGTDGADRYRFVPGAVDRIEVNGIAYRFAAEVESYAVDAGAGRDTLELEDSPGDDTLEIRPGAVDYRGPGYLFTALSCESVFARAGTSSPDRDRAYLYDTPASDRLTCRAELVKLQGGGQLSSVQGYEEVYAVANSPDQTGAVDRAVFYGSAATERFLSRPKFSWLRGGNRFHHARGFDEVLAVGDSRDTAKLFGGEGRDTFSGRTAASVLRRQDTGAGGTVKTTVSGFREVAAWAGGGRDHAELFDTPADDRLRRVSRQVEFRPGEGPAELILARRFEQVTVDSHSGGVDTAVLIDTASDELFESVGDWASFGCQDPQFNYLCELLAFEKLTAVGSQGGTNLKRLTNPIAQLEFRGEWCEE